MLARLDSSARMAIRVYADILGFRGRCSEAAGWRCMLKRGVRDDGACSLLLPILHPSLHVWFASLLLPLC